MESQYSPEEVALADGGMMDSTKQSLMDVFVVKNDIFISMEFIK